MYLSETFYLTSSRETLSYRLSRMIYRTRQRHGDVLIAWNSIQRRLVNVHGVRFCKWRFGGSRRLLGDTVFVVKTTKIIICWKAASTVE